MLKKEPIDLQSHDSQNSPTPIELKQNQKALWQADREMWRKSHPFNAELAQGLKLVPVLDDRLPSATTDGRHLFFNARFSAGLDAGSRRFLQAHLMWHCVAGHILPHRLQNTHRWHLACDHQVNSLLLQQGFVMPAHAVLFFSKIGSSAEETYNWLMGHPALEREFSMDRLVHQCTGPACSSAHDIDFSPTAPEQGLIEAWQSRAGAVIRDYRGAPRLPETVSTMLIA